LIIGGKLEENISIGIFGATSNTANIEWLDRLLFNWQVLLLND
jgi:hypothetical protein